MSDYEDFLKTLKVKQLKYLLTVKNVQIPTEKRTLLKLITEKLM